MLDAEQLTQSYKVCTAKVCKGSWDQMINFQLYTWHEYQVVMPSNWGGELNGLTAIEEI